jgi:pimeloyl-ACP methyl ester carboxylesterase
MCPYALIRTVDKDKIEKWCKDGFRTSLRDLPNGDGNKEFRVPYANLEDASRYNLLDEVGKIKASLGLVAGEKDNLIPPEDVERIFEKAKPPKKMVVIQDVGHDYRRSPDEIERVNATIMKLLDELG